MYRKSVRKRDDRRGAVLLIVLSLLFLFAALGVTFAVMAKMEGQAARNFKRGSHLSDSGAPPAVIDMPAEELMKFALSQLIYDTGNTSSALRGHSLLRDMYGGVEADPRVRNTGRGADATGPFATHGDANQFDGRNAWLNVFNGTGIEAPFGDTADHQTAYTFTGLSADEIELADVISAFRFPFSQKHGGRYLSVTQTEWLNAAADATPLFPALPANTTPEYHGLRFPFNFTLFDEVGDSNRAATGDPVEAGAAEFTIGTENFKVRTPERYRYSADHDHYFAYDEDYDAADYNNWFLALERPDGTILIPSFHRPHLVAQLAQTTPQTASTWGTGTATSTLQEHIESVNNPWVIPEGWRYILRPRRREYAGGDGIPFDATTPQNWPRYANGTGYSDDYNNWEDLRLDPNGPKLNLGGGRVAAIWGDQPEELDVDTDGDGLRDAVWIDLGYAPQQFGTAWAKPLFAFKVVDLDGRLNVNVHGNPGTSDTTTATVAHASNLGASPAEINPEKVLYLNTSTDDGKLRSLLVGRDHGVAGQQIAGRWNPSTGTIANDDKPGKQETDPADSDDSEFVTGQGHSSSPSSPPSQIYAKLKWDTLSKATHSTYSNRDHFQRLFQDLGWFGGLFNNTPYPDDINVRTGYFSWGLPDTLGIGTFDEPVGDQVIPQFSGYPTDAAMSVDEWTEVNPYINDSQDSLFTASQIEALYRMLDIDSSALDPRLLLLLKENLNPDIATATAEQLYAAKRIRRMLTHLSVDLNHYNMPPVFNGGAVLDTNDIAGWEDHSQRIQMILNAGQVPPDVYNDGAKRHNGVLDGAYYNYGVQATPNEIDPNPADPAALDNTNVRVIVNPIQRLDLQDFINVHYGTTTLAVPTGVTIDVTEILDLFPKEILHGRRLNLNRPLRKYRETEDRSSSTAVNLGAELDRQILASQIYMLLRMVTHSDVDPTVASITSVDDYDIRAHMLAQLAVNIVDYIDPDDVVTKFYYDLDLRDDEFVVSSPNTRFVYGCELPRLVINEAIAFWYQEMIEGDTATDVYSFVELRNPWSDADLEVGLSAENQAAAPSVFPSTGARAHSRSLEENYKIHVDMRFEGNPAGLAPYDFTSSDTGPPMTGRRITSDENFTVGPSSLLAPNPPPATPPTFLNDFTYPDDLDLQSDAHFHFKFGSIPADPADPDVEVVVSLMRLRNPYEAFDPAYNPYMVIDQFKLDERAIHDITPRDVSYNVDNANGDPATPLEDRVSQERVQPWIGNWVDDQAQADENERFVIHESGGGAGGRSHSFKVQGTTSGINDKSGATGDYSEIVFLNRALASPLELLNVRMFGFRVSAASDDVAPDDPIALDGPYVAMPLTRDMHSNLAFTGDTLMRDAATGKIHQVPWTRDYFKPRASGGLFGVDLGDLYRFFEFVETPSLFRGSGVHWQPLHYPEEPESPGGTTIITDDFVPVDYRDARVHGKINLNTVTGEEVFRALIDEEVAEPGTTLPFEDVDVYPGDDRENNLLVMFPHLAGDTTNGKRSDDVLNSEMFRWLLLSRSGADAQIGTGDDKPFRSFAQGRISDTLLRPRDTSQLDINTDLGFNNDHDRLRRLFDPISNTYQPNGVGTAQDADKFTNMEDQRQRHQLLAKIGGNVTTRSNVFAVWVTVGFFQIVPGTEGLDVPLLDAEIGRDTGTAVRHRAFFIIDRTLATGYNGPESITSFSAVPVIRLHRLVE